MTTPEIIYVSVSIVLFVGILVLQIKYSIIRDSSIAKPRPYSFSRLQLVWWTCIVLAAIVTIIIAYGQIPQLTESSLILLGIGSLTTVSARLIDISDSNTLPPRNLSVNERSQGFWLDILSDKDGVSIHRLQALIFNLVFGIWFITQTYQRVNGTDPNAIIPVFESGNLVLLGLSAGTYVTLKSIENKK